MTPGNNGASTPEDDDPFGYLYADGQANGATPPPGGGGYGYPGSVNRVRAVGERQYGQQPGYGQQAQPGYGQQPPTAQYGQVPQQQAYGQNAHYAAPETMGGAPTSRQPLPGDGGGRGRGPNTKGLLIGAIAVVAVVAIGIGVAMLGGGADDDNSSDNVSSTPSTAQSASPSASASKSSGASAELPAVDAKALNLGTGVSTASDVEGALSDGGVYVTGLNATGASVTWNVSDIPKAGAYTLFARYSAAGDDQSMTLTVNGKVFGSKLSMKNYTGAADGDFAKGWTKTYAYPTLNKGTNTITISCGDGDSCNVLLDQLSLKEGQVGD
ncbi:MULTISPECIES: CBM35 domain-containing protein [unclassified Streptomyces]|uniref:CBM35 domain-containing protein n=1 Tax=unclassified Streptomyces TaxID=2593676 RepID=UPI002E8166EC|nr:carbohydrate-binding protein [Streptomyces sp. NBC_00589]WTI38271.1 carbohydrate-binding protein [Streptomyces sp. NBC_00775]WUB28050.1 carbohydrate-binding protein [Streptomyces sp. NBC_00589]